MWPFSKKHTPPQSPAEKLPVFEFKSGEALFEMMCTLAEVKIIPRKGYVALVLDAVKEFSQSVAVKVESDGTQLAMLKVTSREGGFIVPAKTPGKGDVLKPGDVVVWVPMHYDKGLAKKTGSINFGWIGLIRAKIAPYWDPNPGGSYKFICQYPME